MENYFLNNQIAFAGNGHGGIAALKSLSLYFDNIEVLTNDTNIREIQRDADDSIYSINDFKSQIIICAGYLEIVPEEIHEGFIRMVLRRFLSGSKDGA